MKNNNPLLLITIIFVLLAIWCQLRVLTAALHDKATPIEVNLATGLDAANDSVTCVPSPVTR